jgi:hypothetical protein
LYTNKGRETTASELSDRRYRIPVRAAAAPSTFWRQVRISSAFEAREERPFSEICGPDRSGASVENRAERRRLRRCNSWLAAASPEAEDDPDARIR